jgi:hypothetical protein
MDEEQPQRALKPGKIGGDRVSPGAQKLTSEREAQILELRLRKIPFEKIGQTVGLSKSATYKAFRRALHRVPVRYAKDIIVEDLESLDRMESRLWREIEKPGVDVKIVCNLIGQALRVQQRRAKLLGLDAPQQIDVSVLKQASEDNEHAAGKEQEMLDCLSPEDKRELLALISKLSESTGKTASK